MERVPPLWLESRWAAELGALSASPVFWGAGVAGGNGQHVLLVPGFLAGDPSLWVLASWLRRIGYRPMPSGINANVQCLADAVEQQSELAEREVIRCGSPIAVIGQSRGGVVATALAAARPELVSGVVALGSPLTDQMAIHPVVAAAVRRVAAFGDGGAPGVFSSRCLRGECCSDTWARMSRLPDGVDLVSVYSRSDGIVDWRACLHPQAEHVEVKSSHVGMAAHPATYRVIAAALRRFAGRSAAYGTPTVGLVA
jgi:pimeloyl-ACP methyl ester carboxylesterase